jgi:VIT1/CCC1 family predicted Fe2+/Mn2+ transporter
VEVPSAVSPGPARPFQTRFSFGATSGIITNLGLISGLGAAADSRKAIIGSILVIAVADNISDSLGIHFFQESERVGEPEVWLSTLTNYLARLLVSLTFVAFIAVLPLKIAMLCSVAWGVLLLVGLSVLIARAREERALPTILEHVAIAAVVILASRYVGKLLVGWF